MTSETPEPTSAAESASGMLTRLARGLFGSFASTDTAAAGQPPPLDPRLGPWVAKVKSAANAVEQIAGGSHVFVGTACAHAAHAGGGAGDDAVSAGRRRVRALHHRRRGAARRTGPRHDAFPAPHVLRRLRHPRGGQAGAGRIRADVDRPRAAADRERAHSRRRRADPGVDARRVRLREPGRVGGRDTGGDRQGETGDRRGQSRHAADDGRLDAPRRPHRRLVPVATPVARVRRTRRPRTRSSSRSRATSAASSRTARRCRSAWAASPTRRSSTWPTARTWASTPT